MKPYTYRKHMWSGPNGLLAIATILMVIAFLAFPQLASAAPADDELEQAPACQLRVGTGKSGKGYSRVFKNIKDICGNRVALCEVPTTGGLQNLMGMAANDADIGFVQVDTLKDMGAGNEDISRFLAVAPTGNNLLHILVNADGAVVKNVTKGKDEYFGLKKGADVVTTSQVYIAKFSDLKNVKAPIGLVGTAQLMARQLDRVLGYGLNFVDYDDDSAAQTDLRAGKVWAVMTVSAWNTGLKDLTPASKLKMIPFDLSPQGNYSVVKKPYPKMNVYNMPFLAVPNLLVTRPFRPNSKFGTAVSALQSCLADNLGDLQDGSYEPVWKDVRSAGDTYGVTRFLGATPVAPAKKRK